MRSVQRALARFVRAGRIRHAFAGSLAIGLVVIPAVTALAFFLTTGQGQVTTAAAVASGPVRGWPRRSFGNTSGATGQKDLNPG